MPTRCPSASRSTSRPCAAECRISRRVAATWSDSTSRFRGRPTRTPRVVSAAEAQPSPHSFHRPPKQDCRLPKAGSRFAWQESHKEMSVNNVAPVRFYRAGCSGSRPSSGKYSAPSRLLHPRGPMRPHMNDIGRLSFWINARWRIGRPRDILWPTRPSSRARRDALVGFADGGDLARDRTADAGRSGFVRLPAGQAAAPVCSTRGGGCVPDRSLPMSHELPSGSTGGTSRGLPEVAAIVVRPA